MDKNEQIALMQSKGVPECNHEKLAAAAAVLNIDFQKILALFISYGPVLFKLLVDLGLLKPAPTPPA